MLLDDNNNKKKSKTFPFPVRHQQLVVPSLSLCIVLYPGIISRAPGIFQSCLLLFVLVLLRQKLAQL